MNDSEKYTISVPEAGKKYFNLSKNGAYKMAARGVLPTIRVGHLLRVPVAAMERMMQTPEMAPVQSNQPVLQSNTYYRRFTPEDDALIKADYAAYVPTQDTAAKLGRDHGTLRQRIFHLGLRHSSRASKLLQWAPEHLAAAVRTGELAPDEFITRCHEWRDAQNLQAHEQQSEQQSEQRQELLRQVAEIDARDDLKRNDKMRAKRMLGITLEEIGAQYGLTRERVRQLTDPNYKPGRPAGTFSPLQKLERLEQRISKAREAVIEEALAALRALWDRCPPEAQQRFRQQMESELPRK
jgi:DNA-binding transcriptional MerR regulator